MYQILYRASLCFFSLGTDEEKAITSNSHHLHCNQHKLHFLDYCLSGVLSELHIANCICLVLENRRYIVFPMVLCLYSPVPLKSVLVVKLSSHGSIGHKASHPMCFRQQLDLLEKTPFTVIVGKSLLTSREASMLFQGMPNCLMACNEKISSSSDSHPQEKFIRCPKF